MNWPDIVLLNGPTAFWCQSVFAEVNERELAAGFHKLFEYGRHENKDCVWSSDVNAPWDPECFMYNHLAGFAAPSCSLASSSTSSSHSSPLTPLSCPVVELPAAGGGASSSLSSSNAAGSANG